MIYFTKPDVWFNILAETRREEITRFSRAKADPDFAKMLKVRTLGPEHAETQSQLRKQVRVRAMISISSTTADVIVHTDRL